MANYGAFMGNKVFAGLALKVFDPPVEESIYRGHFDVSISVPCGVEDQKAVHRFGGLPRHTRETVTVKAASAEEAQRKGEALSFKRWALPRRAPRERRPHGVSAVDPRWRAYRAKRANAGTQGIEFTVSFEEIEWPEMCPVFGLRLKYASGGGDWAASFDRTDSSKGYVPGNVAVMSARANALKSNASVSELEAVLRYVKRCSAD